MASATKRRERGFAKKKKKAQLGRRHSTAGTRAHRVPEASTISTDKACVFVDGWLGRFMSWGFEADATAGRQQPPFEAAGGFTCKRIFKVNEGGRPAGKKRTLADLLKAGGRSGDHYTADLGGRTFVHRTRRVYPAEGRGSISAARASTTTAGAQGSRSGSGSQPGRTRSARVLWC